MMSALLLLAAGFLARQSYLGNFRYPADVRNPYVYAHTSTALMRLVQRVEDLTPFHPQSHRLHINIVRPDGDYWPLPWYLRAYPHVGYWSEIPEQADADVIIADPALYEMLDARLRREYQVEFHSLRPGVLLHAYIHKPLWDTFIDSRR